MEKYVFLTDIDGTLLRGKMEIPVSVIAAAAEFISAGGLLGLCTGRSMVSVVEIAGLMQVNAPSVLYNGSAIYDFSAGEFLKNRSFDKGIFESVERAYGLFPKVAISVQTNRGIFLIRTTEHFSKKCIKEELPDKISTIDDIRGDVLKIVFASEDIDSLRNCGEECFSDHMFAFASKRFAEAVPKGSGKGAGLNDISEICNVPTGRFFMAGDAMTDLPAIKMAGFSFAPSDAAPQLLETCSMTIPPCEEGGMEKAFRIATGMIQML